MGVRSLSSSFLHQEGSNLCLFDSETKTNLDFPGRFQWVCDHPLPSVLGVRIKRGADPDGSHHEDPETPTPGLVLTGPTLVTRNRGNTRLYRVVSHIHTFPESPTRGSERSRVEGVGESGRIRSSDPVVQVPHPSVTRKRSSS